jgi:hypothetical protein
MNLPSKGDLIVIRDKEGKQRGTAQVSHVDKDSLVVECDQLPPGTATGDHVEIDEWHGLRRS